MRARGGGGFLRRRGVMRELLGNGRDVRTGDCAEMTLADWGGSARLHGLPATAACFALAEWTQAG